MPGMALSAPATAVSVAWVPLERAVAKEAYVVATLARPLATPESPVQAMSKYMSWAIS